MDLELLLHWNRTASRLRPVLADDWVNPQRPKPDLMASEVEVLIKHGVADGRIQEEQASTIRTWFETVHGFMAEYDPDTDNPVEFEHALLRRSLGELHRRMAGNN